MKKKNAIMFLVFVLEALPCSAWAIPAQGIYTGIEYGWLKRDVQHFAISISSTSSSVTTTSISVTPNENFRKIYVGKYINKNFALELDYSDYGNLNGIVNGGSIPASISLTFYEVVGYLIYPGKSVFGLFSRNSHTIELFVRYGLGLVKYSGQYAYSQESGSGLLSAGFGVRYELNDRLRLGITYIGYLYSSEIQGDVSNTKIKIVDSHNLTSSGINLSYFF